MYTVAHLEQEWTNKAVFSEMNKISVGWKFVLSLLSTNHPKILSLVFSIIRYRLWVSVCLRVSVFLMITATHLYRLSWNLQSTHLVPRRSDVYVTFFISSRFIMAAFFLAKDLAAGSKLIARKNWTCVAKENFPCHFTKFFLSFKKIRF